MSDLPTVHIHAPPYVAGRLVIYCRTCRKKRRAVALHTAWYEPLVYCCGCGEDPREPRHRFTNITWERQRRIDSAKQWYAKGMKNHEAIRRMADDYKRELMLPESEVAALDAIKLPEGKDA